MTTQDGRGDSRVEAEWCIGKWRRAGRPRDLPLEMSIEELGLTLDAVRSSLRDPSTFGKPIKRDDPDECKLGFYNPRIGKMLGMALAPRIGAMLSRPGCSFSNSFLWQYDRTSDMSLHVDRPPLDITMSVPISLDGADTWPVRVRQPNEELIEWPSQPGSVLIFDGRWRPHWRDPFHGQRALVLLMHWRAPAVLWSQLLDADHRRRIGAGALGPQSGWAELAERSAALARMAVPRSAVPALELVDLPAQTLPDGADGADGKEPKDGEGPKDAKERKENQKRGTIVLAPLEDDLALTFDRAELTVRPGDGVAFAARDACRVEWPNGNGTGKVLLGRAHAHAVNARGGKYD